ncbi:AI-2E family transporter [Verrucomicrobiaceae bacterium 227]
MNQRFKRRRRSMETQCFCIAGLFVFALIAFLYVSKSVLLPVILALILMLIFRPFHLILTQRCRLPGSLSALVIVLVASSGMISVGYFLAAPASNYLSRLQEKGVQDRLLKVFAPIKQAHEGITKVAEKVETITDSPADPKPLKEGEMKEVEPGEEEAVAEVVELNDQTDPKPAPEDVEVPEVEAPVQAPAGKTVRVEIKENTVQILYSLLTDFGLYILSTFVLLFFLLAYGAEMSQRMGEARGTPEFLTEIEHDVSSYLFTISAINIGLGTAIGIGLGLLGVPNPILWGVMAALLNFIPYAGALIGAGVVTIIAGMEFSDPGMAAASGLLYLGLSTLEGNLLTPSIVGRRLEINPIIVFVWVLAWAAIWGIAGMLIGLPLLIIFRIVCSRTPSLAFIERVITVRTPTV